MCPGKGVASVFETQNASQYIPGTFVRAMLAFSAWKDVLNALFCPRFYIQFRSERSKRTVTSGLRFFCSTIKKTCQHPFSSKKARVTPITHSIKTTLSWYLYHGNLGRRAQASEQKWGEVCTQRSSRTQKKGEKSAHTFSIITQIRAWFCIWFSIRRSWRARH